MKKKKSKSFINDYSDNQKLSKRSKKENANSKNGFEMLRTQDVISLLGQLKSETQILRLDQICNSLEIKNVTEFRYSRVSESLDLGGGFLPT